MELFLHLCLEIFPLYIPIVLGYLGAKLFQVDKNSIVSILFYFLIPIIFFNVALNMKLQLSFFLLPLLYFALGVTLCFGYLYFARILWKDGKANLIAFSAGTANSGYFGFPVALMIFEEHEVGIYMLASIGISIYDYTVGAYIMSRNQFTKSESIKKVLKLPMLYAFALGLLCNYWNISLPSNLQPFSLYCRGSYVILGMMVIGLNLADFKITKLDYRFMGMFLSSRFLAAPLIGLMLITLDKNIFHIFDQNIFIYKIIFLLSIVPPAANTVIFATYNKCYPELAAASVCIGSIFAVFDVPMMLSIFI